MKKPILLISTALFLAGCDAAPSEPTVSDAPPIEVTSVALGKAFADNEVAAQTKFGGKTLVVSGKIKAITLDFSDKPVIQLPGQNEFSDVQVSLTDEFAK